MGFLYNMLMSICHSSEMWKKSKLLLCQIFYTFRIQLHLQLVLYDRKNMIHFGLSLVCMCKNIVFFPTAERFAAQTFWISTKFAPVHFPRFVLKNDFCAQGLSVRLYFFFNMF